MNLSNYWKYIFLILFLFLNSFYWVGKTRAQRIDPQAVDLLEALDSVLSKSNGMEFKAELVARMQGKDYHQVALFKFQRNPLKIYYRQFERNQIELLFDETVNSKKALINPAGFPYTNLHLSPYSPYILRRQHHSVFEADPLYTLEQLFYMFEKCKPDRCTINCKDTTIDNRSYKKITYLNTHYQIEQVGIEKSITIHDFAKMHHVNFYSIVLLNDDLSVSSELNEGDLVKIPSSYARKIEIIINPVARFIQSIVVYDHNGVFERYRYLWFKNNIVFSPMEFSPDNPDYNF